ncbi:hypothetical protein M4951_21545 [Blastopirellula sp. J2-11]|uniref:hypothetical protein n=1 Tax=Blastopirellula sp. J2-11 TaxID=2943192 RepID=UPI0021C5EBF4|nr:hypothetical protein [Blastopirellula sp. J2-11]UUO05939.1 hypothetical protein M4951_21545 [Blastopirellula sp. J2-11]
MTQTEPSPDHVNDSPVTGAPQSRSWFGFTCKIVLYSFFTLCAGTLFAAQYVPEVANALSFLLPEEPAHSCSFGQKSSCQQSASTGPVEYASCCSEASICPKSDVCPGEMTLAEVAPSPSSDGQLVAVEIPPIPPVVD